MPRLERQKDFRAVQALPFCYVCGKDFAPDEVTHSDHVPPKACFADADRNFPLQLPTHFKCNNERKMVDEKIGQVVSLKHGRVPSTQNQRLRFKFFPAIRQAGVMGAVDNIDIHGSVRHWLRGFHAALYREYFPPEARVALETPFPAMKLGPGGPELEPMRLAQHKVFVATIKVNRAANNLDRIECNNGKLVYECVWRQSDSGPWLCVFALNLYDWAELGDIHNFPKRGCAGSYMLAEGRVPEGATKQSELKVAIPNYQPLDPFGR